MPSKKPKIKTQVDTKGAKKSLEFTPEKAVSWFLRGHVSTCKAISEKCGPEALDLIYKNIEKSMIDVLGVEKAVSLLWINRLVVGKAVYEKYGSKALDILRSSIQISMKQLMDAYMSQGLFKIETHDCRDIPGIVKTLVGPGWVPEGDWMESRA